MSKPCPVAVEVFGVNPSVKCPYLIFDKPSNVATCLLVPAFHDRPDCIETLGIGAGCCMAGRAVTPNGGQVDYASLPPNVKRVIVSGILAGACGLYTKHDKGSSHDRNNVRRNTLDSRCN
jgi:hypothetical protein